jgi:AcrR family transcriptional regulator
MARAKVFLDPEVIIDQAYDLIKENGVEGLSVRKLATKLGVSSMTLYNYVENIEEIREKVVFKAFKRVISIMNQSARENPVGSKFFFLSFGESVLEYSNQQGEISQLLCSNEEVMFFDSLLIKEVQKRWNHPRSSYMESKIAVELFFMVLRGLLMKTGSKKQYSGYLAYMVESVFPPE